MFEGKVFEKRQSGCSCLVSLNLQTVGPGSSPTFVEGFPRFSESEDIRVWVPRSSGRLTAAPVARMRP